MFCYALFFLSLNCCLANDLQWADSLRLLCKTEVLIVNLNVNKIMIGIDIGNDMITGRENRNVQGRAVEHGPVCQALEILY